VKSFSGYRLSIRAAVRAFWGGVWNWFEFHEEMNQAIRRYFVQAWHEGMRSVGMEPFAMTTPERVRLDSEITKEIGYIAAFADAIERNSQANGGKLGPLMSRADRWAASYSRIVNLAMTYAQDDPLLEWKIDFPKESCNSCRKLNGKKKRSSYWREKGVYPKCWECLICKGGCKCSFVPATGRATPGPLPSLP
jgi:hypothetical protein